MKFEEVKIGRTFILRLEQGEIIHKEIEKFAIENKISKAIILLLGGIDKKSKLIVGPQDGERRPVIPITLTTEDTRESLGVGTIFPNEKNEPMVHLHMATGRKNNTITGCIRKGVIVWQILEVVVWEIIGGKSKRKLNPNLGFQLLEID